jgi:pimeloyl-ACP methyl ester carboxylesterase
LAGSAEAAERRTDLVRYGDVQIEVVSEGEGPAVVLLPSLARDSDDYDQVAEGLAATGFRVLRPKPRGIGRSIGPMANITLHDFARDIAEVIERLGKGHAVIVGHAYGNWVARMTAADHPNLVRGVVIAAAAAKQYAPELTTAVTNAGNLSLSNEERLAALRFASLLRVTIQRFGCMDGTLRSATASARPSPPCGRTNGGPGARLRCSTSKRSWIPSSRKPSATK